MSDARILIVEDEAITAMDLQDRFEFWGYTAPIIASSGKEALKKAIEIKPDLILMDIGIKNCTDGIKIAKEITNNLDTAIVYLLSYFDEKMMRYMRTTKPYGYISKPFDENQLKFTVEKALYMRKINKMFITSK